MHYLIHHTLLYQFRENPGFRALSVWLAICSRFLSPLIYHLLYGRPFDPCSCDPECTSSMPPVPARTVKDRRSGVVSVTHVPLLFVIGSAGICLRYPAATRSASDWGGFFLSA